MSYQSHYNQPYNQPYGQYPPQPYPGQPYQPYPNYNGLAPGHGAHGGHGYYPPSPGMPPQPLGAGGMWTTLGYDVPALGYQPVATMGPWELARELYTGSRLERSVFDQLLAEVPNFFGARHLKEREARRAHRRIYVRREVDRNSKHYGGAAAFQAFIIWDRDHYSVFHSYGLAENRDRLVAMSLAEVYSLFERLQPTHARLDESCEWAAATAKHLFDLHYDLNTSAHTRRRSYEHRRLYNDSSDSDSLDHRGHGHYRRRRLDDYGYGHPMGPPMQGMYPGAGYGGQYQQYPGQYGQYGGGYPYPALGMPVPPVQAVPVPPYPYGNDPMGYPYRTDAYGNPLENRGWYYGYGRY